MPKQPVAMFSAGDVGSQAIPSSQAIPTSGTNYRGQQQQQYQYNNNNDCSDSPTGYFRAAKQRQQQQQQTQPYRPYHHHNNNHNNNNNCNVRNNKNHYNNHNNNNNNNNSMNNNNMNNNNFATFANRKKYKYNKYHAKNHINSHHNNNNNNNINLNNNNNNSSHHNNNNNNNNYLENQNIIGKRTVPTIDSTNGYRSNAFRSSSSSCSTDTDNTTTATTTTTTTNHHQHHLHQNNSNNNHHHTKAFDPASGRSFIGGSQAYNNNTNHGCKTNDEISILSSNRRRQNSISGAKTDGVEISATPPNQLTTDKRVEKRTTACTTESLSHLASLLLGSSDTYDRRDKTADCANCWTDFGVYTKAVPTTTQRSTCLPSRPSPFETATIATAGGHPSTKTPAVGSDSQCYQTKATNTISSQTNNTANSTPTTPGSYCAKKKHPPKPHWVAHKAEKKANRTGETNPKKQSNATKLGGTPGGLFKQKASAGGGKTSTPPTHTHNKRHHKSEKTHAGMSAALANTATAKTAAPPSAPEAAVPTALLPLPASEPDAKPKVATVEAVPAIGDNAAKEAAAVVATTVVATAVAPTVMVATAAPVAVAAAAPPPVAVRVEPAKEAPAVITYAAVPAMPPPAPTDAKTDDAKATAPKGTTPEPEPEPFSPIRGVGVLRTPTSPSYTLGFLHLVGAQMSPPGGAARATTSIHINPPVMSYGTYNAAASPTATPPSYNFNYANLTNMVDNSPVHRYIQQSNNAQHSILGSGPNAGAANATGAGGSGTGGGAGGGNVIGHLGYQSNPSSQFNQPFLPAHGPTTPLTLAAFMQKDILSDNPYLSGGSGATSDGGFESHPGRSFHGHGPNHSARYSSFFHSSGYRTPAMGAGPHSQHPGMMEGLATNEMLSHMGLGDAGANSAGNNSAGGQRQHNNNTNHYSGYHHGGGGGGLLGVQSSHPFNNIFFQRQRQGHHYPNSNINSNNNNNSSSIGNKARMDGPNNNNVHHDISGGVGAQPKPFKGADPLVAKTAQVLQNSTSSFSSSSGGSASSVTSQASVASRPPADAAAPKAQTSAIETLSARNSKNERTQRSHSLRVRQNLNQRHSREGRHGHQQQQQQHGSGGYGSHQNRAQEATGSGGQHQNFHNLTYVSTGGAGGSGSSGGGHRRTGVSPKSERSYDRRHSRHSHHQHRSHSRRLYEEANNPPSNNNNATPSNTNENHTSTTTPSMTFAAAAASALVPKTADSDSDSSTISVGGEEQSSSQNTKLGSEVTASFSSTSTSSNGLPPDVELVKPTPICGSGRIVHNAKNDLSEDQCRAYAEQLQPPSGDQPHSEETELRKTRYWSNQTKKGPASVDEQTLRTTDSFSSSSASSTCSTSSSLTNGESDRHRDSRKRESRQKHRVNSGSSGGDGSGRRNNDVHPLYDNDPHLQPLLQHHPMMALNEMPSILPGLTIQQMHALPSCILQSHPRPPSVGSNASSTGSAYDFFASISTPPDRFLARAHLIETKEPHPELLNNTRWDKLSQGIWDKFMGAQQTEETFRNKMRLWRYLYIIIKNAFPRFGLYLVGSTISGFGSDTSDVDMCLVSRNVSPNVDARMEALFNLSVLRDALYKTGDFEDFNLIEAKVPILRFRESLHAIEVDLNFNNCVGIKNTHLLYCYSQLDWRLRPLVLVTKLWAQHHNINNAKNMTISSYSLVLMVVHYLQYGVNPPVLPCLHKLFPEKFTLQLRSNDFGYIDMSESIEPYDTDNKTSIGELFLGFLQYYSLFDYGQFAISVRTGGLLPVTLCRMTKSPKNDVHQWKELCIEEPFDLTNTARSVYDYETFERVKAVFVSSWKLLRESFDVSSVFGTLNIQIPSRYPTPTTAEILFGKLESYTPASTTDADENEAAEEEEVPASVEPEVVEEESPASVEPTEVEEEEEVTTNVEEKVVAEEKATMEEVATEGVVAEEVPTEKAATEKVATEEVSTEKVATEEVSPEEVSTEKVATETVATEKVATEEVATEEVSTKKVATEEVATEEVPTKKVSTEKVATEEVATEEVAIEEVPTKKVATEEVVAEKVVAVESAPLVATAESSATETAT